MIICALLLLLLSCLSALPQLPALHDLSPLRPAPPYEFQTYGVMLWLGGVLLLLISGLEFQGLRLRLTRERCIRAAALALITALAATFRFYRLDSVPLEMTSDHVEKLLDIFHLREGARPVFFAHNGGREPLEFYLVWLLISVGFPWSFWTLKFCMALVSTMSIPLMYLLGKELWSRQLGFWAALLCAISAWHVQISRTGLRIAFTPLFVALTMIFFLRALRRGNRNDYILCGLCVGIGMYGYTAFRTILLALPILFSIWAFRARYQRDLSISRTPMRQQILWLCAPALATLIPLIEYALLQPELFWHRASTRLSEVPLGQGVLRQFADNFVQALLMFNYSWDHHWFHNPPGYPALSTIGGILFIVGILLAFRLALRGSFNALALLILIPLMLSASALALAFPLEVPHLGRASGALPIAIVLMAIPLHFLCSRYHQAERWIPLRCALAATLVIAIGISNWQRYFGAYADSYNLNTHPTLAGAKVIEEFLASGGDLGHAYLVSWPHGWDHRALGILMNSPAWNGVLWGKEIDGSDALAQVKQHVSNSARKVYLVGGPHAKNHLEALHEIYPQSTLRVHPQPLRKKTFYSVWVLPRT